MRVLPKTIVVIAICGNLLAIALVIPPDLRSFAERWPGLSTDGDKAWRQRSLPNNVYRRRDRRTAVG